MNNDFIFAEICGYLKTISESLTTIALGIDENLERISDALEENNDMIKDLGNYGEINAR